MSTSWFTDPSQSTTAVAGAAVTRFRFVSNTSTETETLECEPTAADARAMGIAADTVDTGGQVPIFYGGVGRLDVDNSAALTAGTPIKSGAAGLGVAATDEDEFFATLMDPVALRGDSGDPPATVRVIIKGGTLPAAPA